MLYDYRVAGMLYSCHSIVSLKLQSTAEARIESRWGSIPGNIGKNNEMT
jgi:hypothetical protein